MKSSTSKIAMIRPNNFGYNLQTASSNAFQHIPTSEMNTSILSKKALEEFDEVVDMLIFYSIDVLVLPDSSDIALPDAVFPNNWFSTFENIMVTYPMYAQNRRLERREELINTLRIKGNYTKQIHFEEAERFDPPSFLEGTGSLVLDRVNAIAYAALSQRTHAILVEKWCREFNYTPVIFNTIGPNNEPIYHTNVVMTIGLDFAVVCLDCIVEEDREHVIATLNASGKLIIELSKKQTFSYFAGNMIQLLSKSNERILVMSQTAYDHLSEMQITLLKQLNDEIVVCFIPTIEKYGGGSIRCMIAELY